MSARASADGISAGQHSVMNSNLHPPSLQCLKQECCCHSTVANRHLCTVQRLELLLAGSLVVATLLQACCLLCWNDRWPANLTAYFMWQLQFWEHSLRPTLSSCATAGMDSSHHTFRTNAATPPSGYVCCVGAAASPGASHGEPADAQEGRSRCTAGSNRSCGRWVLISCSESGQPPSGCLCGSGVHVEARSRGPASVPMQ